MEIKEAAIKLVESSIEKLVLSSPKSKSSVYRKMTVRPLLIQKQNMYQLERFTEKQAQAYLDIGKKDFYNIIVLL